MKYITTYFTSFIVLLATIGAFNWFIDPFGMYWSPQIENINTVKPEAGSRARITKAYQPEKINPEVLIVGNSRVEMGLNPQSHAFSGLSVYNQGMPGATVAMQVDYAIDAIANNDSIEQLLVGVDFLDFLLNEEEVKQGVNYSTTTRASYHLRLTSQDNNTANAQLLRAKEKLGLIFSLDALSASISTITQQKSLVNSIDPLGFNGAKSYVDIMNTEGIKPLFSQKLDEIETRLQRNPWQVISQESYPYSPIFSHLGRLIKSAKNKNIKITFFINPYHASYLHTLADNQQWQNFALWKRTLVSYLTQEQQDKFSLWDFSGFSDYVNEAVSLSTPKKLMQWYWEPAHYRMELGEIILSKLLSRKHLEADNNTTKNISKFGVNLTSKNITSQLDADTQGLKASMSQWRTLQTKLQ